MSRNDGSLGHPQAPGHPPAAGTRAMFGSVHTGVGRLLYGFIAAPIAWATHFGAIYVVNALFCTEGWNGDAVAVLVVTIPFAAVAASSGWIAWRDCRRLREHAHGTRDEVMNAPGAVVTLLMLGAFGAPLWLALIIAEAVAPVFVPACGMHAP